MHYFCVTHREIPWRLPGFMTQVGTGDHIPDRGLALSRDFPAWAHRNRSYSEYAALFALRRLLEQEPGGDFVGFAHWRRFPVTRSVAPVVEINQVVDPEVFETLPDELFLGDGHTVLAPPLVGFGVSVLQQYAVCHITRDLLHFMADAVDEEVITDAEAASFLGQHGFIPAPSAVVVPTSWAIENLRALERVVTRFEAGSHVRREGYQERAIGFCLERLNALLLQRFLSTQEPSGVALQLALAVTVDGRIAPTR